MPIGDKTFRTISSEFYGIALGIFILCCLAACVIYPVATQAEPGVVFLRTTFPTVPDVKDENVDIEEPETPLDDPEQRLVSMLMKDDFQVTYEKLEDKERWQIVRMRVTGYCSCPKCCGKFSDGKTASKHRIHKGDVFVAADKCYGFGTEMVIPGYNQTQPVQVLDRGRAIKDNRLDVYFDSHQQAKKWGVKYLDVLVKTD